MIDPMDEMAEKIAKMNISTYEIAFRGDTSDDGKAMYPLKVYCQLCGRCRFTPEEVKAFSDPNLTFETFMTHHEGHRFSHKGCCQSEECENLLRAMSGGAMQAYDLRWAFSFDEVRAYYYKVDKKNRDAPRPESRPKV